MTYSVIYTNTLLPEILDFCQSFFPSLIEYSCNNCASEPQPTPKDIDIISTKLIKALKKSLSIEALKIPIQQPEHHLKLTYSQAIEDLVLQLSHHLSCATQIPITPTANPLAPPRLLSLIAELLEVNFCRCAEVLYANIERQFLLLAKGFYKKLNALAIQYITCMNKNETIIFPVASELPKNAQLYLDEQGLLLAQKNLDTPSVEQTQTAIEQTQNFFNSELSTQIIGLQFNALCKKIYIPAVQHAISNPNAFNAGSTDEFKQLLIHIKIIGIYHNALQKQQRSDEIVTAAKKIIQGFSENAMKGEIDLTQTLSALQPLALKCQNIKIFGHFKSPSESALTAKPAVNPESIISAQPILEKKPNTHLFKEGMWFDYSNGNTVLRCKLAAIIKPIKRYIFVSREGQKILDLNYDQLQKKLANRELLPCNQIVLDSCLEKVLSDLKSYH